MDPIKALLARESVKERAVGEKYILERIRNNEAGLSEIERARALESQCPDIEKAKYSSLEAIVEENRERTIVHSEGLTAEEVQKVKHEISCSDEVAEKIRSWEEYEIYKRAALREAVIGDRIALIRNDIDWNQLDEKGKTNAERVEKGRPPLAKDGTAIELHHIGQRIDSPLAELTFREHRCDGNDIILHNKKIETETHGAGSIWDSERQRYWKDRANYNRGANPSA